MRPRDLRALGVRLTAALALSLVLVAGCDEGTNGGIDGDDDDDDPTPEVPALLGYGGGGDLRLTFSPADTMHLHFSLQGRWAAAIDSMTIEGGIEADAGPGPFRPFHLGISTPLIRLRGSHPIAGAWGQQSGPQSLGLEVIPDAGGGDPGVSVRYYADGLPSGDTTLVWADLGDPGAGAPDWIEWAADGYWTLGTAIGHVALGAGDLAFAIGHDADIVAAGDAGTDVAGEVFPGSGAAGTANYRWLDMNGSGTLSPMDAFTFSRAGWWIAGAVPGAGSLLDGEWSLRDYIENRDPVIAIGGRLDFTDLRWRGAHERGGAWIVDDPGVAAAGSGNLFLQEIR